MDFNNILLINEQIDSANILNTITASTDTVDTAASSMILGGVAGFLVFFIAVCCLIGLVITVLNIIATWKIFVKAGEKGWKSLIPIYNAVILFKVAGISPLWILGYLACWVPIVGPLFVLGIFIYLNIKLSRAFGKEDAFAVGLVLLNTIFTMILGFGKAEYQLNKTQEAEIVDKK